MRGCLTSFLSFAFACIFSISAQGLTIPASEDTTAFLSRLTAAANTSPTLIVDVSHKAFLYFNLDEIPQDAVLRWAKLRLFFPIVRTRGSGIGVHVVTSSWDEALVLCAASD